MSTSCYQREQQIGTAAMTRSRRSRAASGLDKGPEREPRHLEKGVITAQTLTGRNSWPRPHGGRFGRRRSSSVHRAFERHQVVVEGGNISTVSSARTLSDRHLKGFPSDCDACLPGHGRRWET